MMKTAFIIKLGRVLFLIKVRIAIEFIINFCCYISPRLFSHSLLANVNMTYNTFQNVQTEIQPAGASKNISKAYSAKR